ncbi:MAG: AMP-binding protein [Myxococcota bacterium]
MTITDEPRARAIQARHHVREGQRALAAESWLEAARCFMAAIELAPRDGLAWYGQGLALEALGQPTASREAMQRAVALDGTLAARGISHGKTPLPSVPTSAGLQVPLPERTHRQPRPTADLGEALARLGTQSDWSFAVVRPGRQVDVVSGEQWVARARPWAAAFREQPHPILPMLGRTDGEVFAAWLGAILAGRAPTLLSYPSTKIQGTYFAEKIARYRALFGGAPVMGQAGDASTVDGIVCRKDLPANFEFDGPTLVGARDTLFVQCSSGTTGLQKAVAVTRAQLERQVAAYADVLHLDANVDRIVSWLPLYHDMGLIATLWLPLLMDVPVVFLDPFEWAAQPRALYEVLAGVRGTLVWQPNFAYALACRTPVDVDLSSVRAFVSCAEPISPQVTDRFLRAFPVRRDQLAHCYALAENVFAATQSPIGEPPRFASFDPVALARGEVRRLAKGGVRLASCGRPIPGVQIRIEADLDRVGEILIRGPFTIDRYLGQEPTRIDGWVATGDLGFVDDGELFVTGRQADLIVHQGRNVQPHDLEEVMDGIEGVQPGRTMAVGVPDSESGTERIWAMFEPARGLGWPEADAIARTIEDAVYGSFLVRPDVMPVPRGWLRKTSSGKIARRDNAQRRATQTARHVHVIGDSHVQVLWRTFKVDFYERLHAHWVGQVWSEGWTSVWPLIERVARRIRPEDELVFSAGEAECRTRFAVAPDPFVAIDQAVDGYRALFERLRSIRPEGRITYMTGIPTRTHEVASPSPEWPIRGALVDRVAHQARFYQTMRAWCNASGFGFVDACSPFQNPDGTVQEARLHDGVHLAASHRRAWVGTLIEALGLVDLTPSPEAPRPVFDGSYDDFYERCIAFVRARARGRTIDEERLVTSGLLDSIGVVEFIGFLEAQFSLGIDLVGVQRSDFDALRGIYDRWVKR